MTAAARSTRRDRRSGSSADLDIRDPCEVRDHAADRPRSRRLGLLVAGRSLLAAPRRPTRPTAKPKVTFQDQVVADLPEPLQLLPQRRQAEGRAEPRDLRHRDARAAARARSSSRATPTAARSSTSSRTRTSRRCRRTRPRSPTPSSRSIKAWIEGGALETSGSVAAAKAKPKFEFKLDPSAMGKPVGPPAMPESVLDRAGRRQRPGRTPIVAMAASPWAPLVAVGGHKQVLLYHTTTEPPGRRPAVPRGDDPRPQVQPQRRAAAGRRRPGRAVGPGGRLGREDGQAGLRDRQGIRRRPRRRHQPRPRPGRPRRPEQDRPRLQHGRRPARVRDRRSTPSGSPPLEFSPDGVLLASGDRNNGLFVWEAADRPRVLRPPRPHRGDHRRLLAARLERPRLVQRGRHGPALGDGERQPDQELGRPRRRRRLGPVRQGRPARHRRPRPRRPALGPERRQAARLRGLRRPGPRRRLHPRRRPRSSPATGRARSASGTRRTASGSPTSSPTPPRSPSGSSRPARPCAAAQAAADAAVKALAPLQAAAAEKAAAQAKAAAGARRASRTSPPRRPRPTPPRRPSRRRPPRKRPRLDALAAAAGRRAEGERRQGRRRQGRRRHGRRREGRARRPRPPPRRPSRPPRAARPSRTRPSPPAAALNAATASRPPTRRRPSSPSRRCRPPS